MKILCNFKNIIPKTASILVLNLTFFPNNKKYHTVWYRGKYRIFLLHKVVKIKFLGIFTIYKLSKHREFIDKKVQEMKEIQRNFYGETK